MDKPILVLGAMQCEIDYILSVLEGVNKHSTLGYEYYIGKINGWRVAVGRTKIGMINAAILSLTLVQKLKPCCIIVQGTAGSHSKTVNIGDIVLAKSVININT